ncbi:glycosyltransferase [Muricoccus radiodurans]|uniref:glycosyltransferase n=1 Tax=Muricoccus radiodurans TaxID=2231721 RepID=UPI003CEE9D5F
MSAVLLQRPDPSPDPQGPGDDAVRVFRLPAGLLLITAADPGARGGGLEIRLDGAAPPPPVCTILLDAPGHMLHVAVVRAGHAGVTPSLELRLGGQRLAEPGDLAWDGAPAFLAAAGELPAPARARLLRFLVETCVPLFRAGRDARLSALLLRLSRGPWPRGGAPPCTVRPITRPGLSAPSLWQVAGEVGEGAWHLLSASRIARIAPPAAGILLLDGGYRLDGAVLLPPPGRDGAARPPLPLDPRPAGGLPGLLAPGAEDAPGRRMVARALARHAAARPNDPRAARLLRDQRLLATPAAPRGLDDPARPVGGALELAVSDGAGGVFVAGWLRDPLGIATGGLALRDPLTGVSVPVPADALHRVARPDLAGRHAKATHGDAGAAPGFVAHLPGAEGVSAGPVPQWCLDLRLASGEAIEFVAPPGVLPPARARDLVLRAVHPAALRQEVLDFCLAPAVARLQRAALEALGAPEIVAIGVPPAPGGTAVVVPLYRNLRFLRFQFAAFARDAAFRAAAHLVFVLDSPEQRAEAEHLLRGLHAVHGLPATLVVMAANAGYASACNAGAAAARETEHVLLLNSDVVPDRPGWLAAMLRPMERDAAVLAVGPKLLFEDGSVQHAGLLFVRHGPEGDWLNGHYGKGLPRHHPEVSRDREVPGVTGAALLVRRTAFEAVGGLCTDYVVGDYEDSDLCLRLRALGGHIRYAAAAELYHFERQSIVGHGGYARTLACAHNRRLHHRRWDREIEALMARFPASRRI